MVKMNTSSSEIAAADTRYVISSEVVGPSSSERSASTADDEGIVSETADQSAAVSGTTRKPRIIPMEHSSKREPLPEDLADMRAARQSSAARTTAIASETETAVPLEVGALKDIFIDTETTINSYGDTVGDYRAQICVLAAVSENCYVWIAKQNYDSSAVAGCGTDPSETLLTSADAEAIQERFDRIVPNMRSLLGEESNKIYTSSGFTTLTDDTRINIVLFDIYGDGAPTDDDPGRVLGYFYARDYYSSEYYSSSNEGKYIYLDSYFAHKEPKTVYSAAVHEFQHMRNFSRKYWDFYNPLYNTEDWFDEMMSMLSEDIMAAQLGFSDTDVWAYGPQGRLYNVYPYYWKRGITDFTNDDLIPALQYAAVYAFGAYLVRNYGGVPFFQAMMDCDYVGKAAVEYALKTCSYDETFDSVFTKYAEALLYTAPTAESGHVSFNNSSEITPVNGENYQFIGFDISFDQYESSDVNFDPENVLTVFKSSSAQYSLFDYGGYISKYRNEEINYIDPILSAFRLPSYGLSIH